MHISTLVRTTKQRTKRVCMFASTTPVTIFNDTVVFNIYLHEGAVNMNLVMHNETKNLGKNPKLYSQCLMDYNAPPPLFYEKVLGNALSALQFC